MRSADTRGRIVAEAFALFAERGYHAVSVRDIAAAAGIKDASLYNHFTSKQAIFDAVVAQEVEHTREVFEGQGVMLTPTDDLTGYAGSIEETERRVLAGFRHFFEDENMVRLHRLLATSRFQDERAAEAYRFVFIEQAVAIQRAVFEHMMALGQFARDDAAVMAREFYGPIFLLLESGTAWVDAEPLISGHSRRFFAAHVSVASDKGAREGNRQ